MSMIRELTHFLGLQICQQDLGIFLSQSKYARNLVKKFGFESTSFVRTPMSSNVKLTVDYGICQEHLTFYCDNTSAINISKNPVQHS